MKLSVIIPNFNHGRFLKATLDALISQSRIPEEIIVVDDGSTDDSLEVIAPYLDHPSVILLKNEWNLGATQAANRAFEISTGDYIYPHSADDLVLPGFVEKSMRMVERYPNAALCCSHPAFFDDATGEIDKHEDWYHYSTQPSFLMPEQVADASGPDGLWIAGHTSIIKKSVIQECGIFRPELKWLCDFFVVYVAAFRYGICYVPEALSALRVLPNSYSASGSKDFFAQAEVLWKLVELIKSDSYKDVLLLFIRSKVLDTYPLFSRNIRKSLDPDLWNAWARDAKAESALEEKWADANALIGKLTDRISKLENSNSELSSRLSHAEARLDDIQSNLRLYNDFKKSLNFIKPVYNRFKPKAP